MYYIAKEADFDLLKKSYVVADDFCNTEYGFRMPSLTDDELMEHITKGGILVSDLGEDGYCANVCFEVCDDHVMVLWTISDERHPGDSDSMLSYLILNYKLPLRYWLVAGSAVEQETVNGSDYLSENTAFLNVEKTDEHGSILRLYEFKAPELALFKDGGSV